VRKKRRKGKKELSNPATSFALNVPFFVKRGRGEKGKNPGGVRGGGGGRKKKKKGERGNRRFAPLLPHISNSN